jgi:FkbM family methyltransferase
MTIKFFIYNSQAFKKFLKNNPHENGEIKFLESNLQKGMNVIDIGGYIGVSSVVIAKSIGETGRLYTFEPVPEHFNILNVNISSNGLGNVKTYQRVVEDHVGTIDFYKNDASSTIVPETSKYKLQARTTTIDSFVRTAGIDRIDFINMDCEGSELFVLQGARQTLLNNKIKIFCEIHHSFLKSLELSIQMLVEYLHELNFQVHSLMLDDLVLGDDFEVCDYIYAYR